MITEKSVGLFRDSQRSRVLACCSKSTAPPTRKTCIKKNARWCFVLPNTGMEPHILVKLDHDFELRAWTVCKLTEHYIIRDNYVLQLGYFTHAYANGSKLMLDSHSYGFLQSVNCY